MNEFCDVVIGSRLAGKITPGSMTLTSKAGNWFFTFLVREFIHGNVTDVLSGYFAWKREVTEKLATVVESEGFAIEMEMVVKTAKMNYELYCVPITYDVREGDSKLHPYLDGLRILRMFFKAAQWNAPKRRK
jgi:hypothetical protein